MALKSAMPSSRYLALAVSLLVAVSLIAASCGSDDDESAPETTSAALTTATPATTAAPATSPAAAVSSDGCVETDDPPRLALVVNQSAGDRGPIDDLKAGLDSTECSLGAETTFIEALDPSTFESTFRSLGSRGFDAVALTFLPMGDALAAVSPEFPETRWIHIYGSPLEADNVTTIGFLYHQGMYLAGLLAGALTANDRVGIVIGASFPTTNADANAFKQAVETQNPDASVEAAFTGSYDDTALGKEAASAVFDNGADIIMMGAAGADAGIMEASDEKEGYTISGSLHHFDNPRVIGGVVTDWRKLVVHYFNDALSDDYSAAEVSIDLGAGIFYLNINPLFREQGPSDMVAAIDAVLPSIEEAKDAIISGTLDVPFNPELI